VDRQTIRKITTQIEKVNETHEKALRVFYGTLHTRKIPDGFRVTYDYDAAKKNYFAYLATRRQSYATLKDTTSVLYKDLLKLSKHRRIAVFGSEPLYRTTSLMFGMYAEILDGLALDAAIAFLFAKMVFAAVDELPTQKKTEAKAVSDRKTVLRLDEPTISDLRIKLDRLIPYLPPLKELTDEINKKLRQMKLEDAAKRRFIRNLNKRKG
jgi:hypothetical protein